MFWAVQQSGFDPGSAQAYQTNPQPQQKGEVLRGGAHYRRGDAGKGTAIGATAEGLKRGFQEPGNKRAGQSQSMAPLPAQDT